MRKLSESRLQSLGERAREWKVERRARYLCTRTRVCVCVWREGRPVCCAPTYRRRSKRCSNFAGVERGEARPDRRKAEKKERDVCSNLNFEFRRDAATAWPPGNSRGGVLVSRRMQFSVSASFNFSTGSAGDGSRGIRRRKTRYGCTRTCMCMYVYMYEYICSRGNGDSIPEL